LIFADITAKIYDYTGFEKSESMAAEDVTTAFVTMFRYKFEEV
jgi:hypothetical protein